MKNSLNTLAVALTAAFPLAFIIELAGIHLPAIVDSTHLFGGFMLTFFFKILFADYARAGHPRSAHSAAIAALPAGAGAKDPLRLAA